MFIPVSRDRIFQALAEGEGDIAAADLTITPEREKQVDFSMPLIDRRPRGRCYGRRPAGCRGPRGSVGPEGSRAASSTYYESLTALNDRSRNPAKRPSTIVAAPEPLEDEDLLEMVNAGLIPATIVDDHIAGLWKQVFDQIQVQRCGRAHGRPNRLGGSPRHAEAPGGGQRVHQGKPQGLAGLQHARASNTSRTRNG